MADLCTTPLRAGDRGYVWAESCTWHGAIVEAGKRSDGTPCCPNCGSPLFEVESEDAFWIMLHQLATAALTTLIISDCESGVRWSRGRCHPNNAELSAAYDRSVGVQL